LEIEVENEKTHCRFQQWVLKKYLNGFGYSFSIPLPEVCVH